MSQNAERPLATANTNTTPHPPSTPGFDMPVLQLRTDADQIISEAMHTVLIPLSLDEAMMVICNIFTYEMINTASPVLLFFLHKPLVSKGSQFPEETSHSFI